MFLTTWWEITQDCKDNYYGPSKLQETYFYVHVLYITVSTENDINDIDIDMILDQMASKNIISQSITMWWLRNVFDENG